MRQIPPNNWQNEDKLTHLLLFPNSQKEKKNLMQTHFLPLLPPWEIAVSEYTIIGKAPCYPNSQTISHGCWSWTQYSQLQLFSVFPSSPFARAFLNGFYKTSQQNIVCTQLLFQPCLQNICCIGNKYCQKNMVPTHSGTHFTLHFLQVSVNILFVITAVRFTVFFPYTFLNILPQYILFHFTSMGSGLPR